VLKNLFRKFVSFLKRERWGLIIVTRKENEKYPLLVQEALKKETRVEHLNGVYGVVGYVGIAGDLNGSKKRAMVEKEYIQTVKRYSEVGYITIHDTEYAEEHPNLKVTHIEDIPVLENGVLLNPKNYEIEHVIGKTLREIFWEYKQNSATYGSIFEIR